MSNIKQIKESEWKEVANPVYIAVLPFKAEEFSEKFGVSLFEYEDDGLGLAKACVLQIGNSQYWISSHPQGAGINHYMAVEVPSIEVNTEVALSKLIAELQISEEELVHCSDELGPAKWVLYRIDDNGNEVEMFRFQRELFANHVKDRYQQKGHKQTYVVTKAT